MMITERSTSDRWSRPYSADGSSPRNRTSELTHTAMSQESCRRPLLMRIYYPTKYSLKLMRECVPTEPLLG